jgi:hypothetical protein
MNGAKMRTKGEQRGKLKKRVAQQFSLQLVSVLRFILPPATSDEITTLAVNRRVAKARVASS